MLKRSSFIALGCALALQAGAADSAIIPGAQLLRNDIQPAEITFNNQEATASTLAANPNLGKHSDNWKSLGIGRYSEDFITTMYNVPSYTWEVEYQENVDEPGVYRIVDPYGANCPYTEGDGVSFNMIINASNPDKVYLESVTTELDFGLGPVTFSSWAYYWMERDNCTIDDVQPMYYGTLRNGVIIFPINYLLVRMRDYIANNAFYANSNRNGVFHLPGSKDYDLEISNVVSPEDPTQAVINYTSSTDFLKINYIFKKAYDDTNYYGMNEKSFVQAMQEGTELTQGEGSLTFDLTKEGRGKYICYMAAFTEDSTIMARANTEFFYDADDPSEWESVGQSKYTDDFFTSIFNIKSSTWNVETERNLKDPNYFRLVNPYKDFKPIEGATYDDEHNYYIYLHILNIKKEQIAYIEESPIGIDLGYGPAKVTCTPVLYNMWGNSWQTVLNFHFGAMPLFASYDDAKRKVSFIKELAWVSMPRYRGGEFITANLKGKFSIVLPVSAGIDDIVADDVDVPAEYFDLNGRPVSADNLPAGIYLERRGSKVSKIAVTR